MTALAVVPTPSTGSQVEYRSRWQWLGWVAVVATSFTQQVAGALLAGLVVVEWAAVRCLRQYPAKAKVTEAPSVTDQRWVSVYLFDTALAEHRLRPLAPIQRPVIERWDTLPGRRPRGMPNASAHARDDRGLVTAGVVASRSAGRLAGLAHAKRATNLQRTKGRSIEYGPLWRRELTSPGD